MAVSVVMPALEMAQETGKLVSWKKKEGEKVAKGDPLLEVETDKAVMEIEAQADGILGGVTAKVGDVVPVGQTIAWLLGAGETPPAVSAQAQTGRTLSGASAAAVAQSVAQEVSPAPAALPTGPVRISPKARRLAKELGVDVSRLFGSGPDGEIVASDVQSAAKSAPPPARPVVQPPPPLASAALGEMTSIGRLMAERTTQSWT